MKELSQLAQIDRQLSGRSLYYLCKEVLGYRDMVPHVHGAMCDFFSNPMYGRFRQMTVPRSWFKCLTAGSRIMTPFGSKTVDLVKPGDLVDSLHGSTEVVATESEVAKVVKVRFSSGRVVTCTPHHPFYTIEGWISAVDLIGKGVFLSSQRVTCPQDPRYATFCGLMAGDGCFSNSTFATRSPELLSWMEDYVGHPLNAWDGLSFYIPQRLTKTLPPELKCLSKNKHYPDPFEGSREFIRALFDCDGTVDPSYVALTTASRNLAFGVQRNLQYFGIMSSVYEYASFNTDGFTGTAYHVKMFGENIEAFAQEIGFSVKDKAERLNLLTARGTVSRVQDVVPGEWRSLLGHGDGYKLRKAGIRVDNEYRTTKTKLREVAVCLNRPELEVLTHAQFDFVVSVEPANDQRVYHIETKDHTYIADNLVNHNTVVLTVGGSIWLTLPDEEGLYKNIFPWKGPNARILIASNVLDNAAKMVHMVRDHWMSNDRLKAAFPELVPDFGKVRWSDHCAELRRTIKATEGTYTAVGAGGSVISQHFDHIQEDDLVYAKKDDFSGMELMPSQDDIDKAIGWHRLAFSLLVDPKKSTSFNVGTRWAPHDVIEYIRKNEKHYKCFEICATHDSIWPIQDDTDLVWPERYDEEALLQIRGSQGVKIMETQYLNRPRAGEDVVFPTEYIHIHDTLKEFPTEGAKLYTIVDLAGWSDKKRVARNCVLTGFKDHFNHLWITRVDVGRYNPSEVIEKFKEHQKQFDSKVLIEEVQYQRAIRHFAKLDMEKTGSFYNLEALPPDNRKDAKNLRIHGLEPLVKNGAFHMLRSMNTLLTELEDYPYGSTVDILDCCAFLNKYAQATTVLYTNDWLNDFERDTIEKELKSKAGVSEYPFSVQSDYWNSPFTQGAF